MIALAVTTVCVSHRIYINKYFHHPAHSTAHTAEPRLLFIFGYFAFDLLSFSISLCPLNSTERTLHVWNAILLSYVYARGGTRIHPSILWYSIWKPHIHSSHYTLAFACSATFTYNIICFGRIWILIIVVKHALPSQQNTHTNTHTRNHLWYLIVVYARVTRNFPYHASMRKRFAAVPTNRKQVAATAVLNASYVCALFNGIGWFELYTVLFGCADETLFPRAAVFRTRSRSLLLLLLHLLVTLSFWEIVFLWVCL